MIPFPFQDGGLGKTRAAGTWTPARLTNPPRMWYNDASAVTDAGSGACSQWNDISGNALHITQATSGARPTIVLGEQNGRRIIRFDGIDDFLFSVAANALNAWQNQGNGWAASVYKKRTSDGAGTNRQIFSADGNTQATRLSMSAGSTVTANRPRMSARRLDADSTAGLEATANSTGNYIMLMSLMDWTNGDGFIWANGSLDASNTSLTTTGSTSNTAGTRFTVGAFSASPSSPSGNGFGDIDLAELICGRTIPTASEIDLIHGYLAWNWGLQGNLASGHPYRNFAP